MAVLFSSRNQDTVQIFIQAVQWWPSEHTQAGRVNWMIWTCGLFELLLSVLSLIWEFISYITHLPLGVLSNPLLNTKLKVRLEGLENHQNTVWMSKGWIGVKYALTHGPSFFIVLIDWLGDGSADKVLATNSWKLSSDRHMYAMARALPSSPSCHCSPSPLKSLSDIYDAVKSLSLSDLY